MKLILACILAVASLQAAAQCDSERFALTGEWQHMSAAPKDGTVFEVIQTWGIAPTYGLARFPQKGSTWASFNEGKSAIEDLTWEDVGSDHQGYLNLGNCLRWRPFNGNPKQYVDPTGGAQYSIAYWCSAAHMRYDKKKDRCY